MVKRNILKVLRKPNTKGLYYQFNEHYENWKSVKENEHSKDVLRKTNTKCKGNLTHSVKENELLSAGNTDPQKHSETLKETSKETSKERSSSTLSPKKKYKFSDKHLKLTEYFINLIKVNKPDYIFKGKDYKQRWANEIRLMVERDKRKLEKIKEVMEFACTNNFWKSNILSVEKLRLHFDELELKMKGEKNARRNKRNTHAGWEESEKYKNL